MQFARRLLLFCPLCSCSQASMNPVPEFMKRSSGLSWLVVGIRAATSRTTPQTTVYSEATPWAGDENCFFHDWSIGLVLRKLRVVVSPLKKGGPKAADPRRLESRH